MKQSAVSGVECVVGGQSTKATSLIPLVVYAVAAALLGASQVRAEIIGGVEFPQGAASFADRVVSYEPLYSGGPGPTHPNFIDPAAALGVPDYSGGSQGTGSVTLGRGGRITLEFVDNLLTASGDSLADLYIFEVGPEVEDTFVEISKDGVQWAAVGKVFGSTSSIDIDAFGFTRADKFSFVRLMDDPNEGSNTGSTVGADIDAVGAIGCLLVKPGDVDRDGDVDIFDVAILQTKYGTVSGATWADGDFDGNGTVDIFDVAAMQVNYGYGVAAAPAPVPEPSTWALAALGMFGLMPFIRLRRMNEPRKGAKTLRA